MQNQFDKSFLIFFHLYSLYGRQNQAFNPNTIPAKNEERKAKKQSRIRK